MQAPYYVIESYRHFRLRTILKARADSFKVFTSLRLGRGNILSLIVSVLLFNKLHLWQNDQLSLEGSKPLIINQTLLSVPLYLFFINEWNSHTTLERNYISAIK